MQNATQQNRVPAAQPRQELRQPQQSGQIPQPQNVRRQPAPQYQQVRRPVQQTQPEYEDTEYYSEQPVNETFFEDDEMEYAQQAPQQYHRGQSYQPPEQPVIVQGYNADQVEILRSVEAIEMVMLNNQDMPEYQKVRLTRAILYLLTLGNMKEMIGNYVEIPKAPAPEPIQRPTPASATQEPIPEDDASFVEPDLNADSKDDLNQITKRLEELDSGVMNPQEPEPKEEKKGLIGRILSGGKKIVPDKTVKEQHIPESMG